MVLRQGPFGLGGSVSGPRVVGGGGGAPDAHASSHENGGSDEVLLEALGTAETDTALVLHPDGAGGAEWGSDMGGGGSLVLLEQHSASASATLDFTSFIASDYDEYLIEILNLIPATNTVDLYVRLSTDGGSSYDAGANYNNATFGFDHTGSGLGGGTGQNQIAIRGTAEIHNNANYGVCGTMRLFGPGGSIYKRTSHQVSYFNSGSRIALIIGNGVYLSATAVNALRLLFSSGNIASGTVRIYGVAKT